MERPSYLSKYMFDWELLKVVTGGRSALDTNFFINPLVDEEQVTDFLKGYGLDPNDPVSRAELFGNFQEALQFIRRYFLKEGNAEGIDLIIPNSIYMITDVSDLFLLATGNVKNSEHEDTLWAEIILKVMHTILHADKDLRTNYFPVIQTQIFDRFYKFLYRDDSKELFMGIKGEEIKIKVLEFETKSRKTRDSVILKLLHKVENVAEELFDRIGVRIITESKFDTIRILKFLVDKYVIVPHNIKPSRSLNSIIDIAKFKEVHTNVIKMAIRNNLSEDRFLAALERGALDCTFVNANSDDDSKNKYSSSSYQAIQFTCRQLIKYKNPFLAEFNDLRRMAKKDESETLLGKKLLNMDVSLIARDIRFFYPFEIQIVDEKAHRENTDGEASHSEYKKIQIKSAMNRVFRPLLEYKGIAVKKN